MTRPSTISTGSPARSAISTGRRSPIRSGRSMAAAASTSSSRSARGRVVQRRSGAASWRDVVLRRAVRPGLFAAAARARAPGRVGLPPRTASACRPGSRRARRGGRSASTRRAATCIPPRATSFAGLAWRAERLASIITRRMRTPSKSAACSPPPHGRRRRRTCRDGGVLAALTSIHWREAWKYGERAFRYCQHDVGHAVAAMRMAAALMGWACAIARRAGRHAALAALLGVDRDADFEGAEPEEPACLMLVAPPGREARSIRAAAARDGRRVARRRRPARRLDRARQQARAPITCSGTGSTPRPKPAAKAPRRAAVSCRRPHGPRCSAATRCGDSRRDGSCSSGAAPQSMDGATAIGDGPLRRDAARGFCRAPARPFDAFPWTPRVHLALFVHRVDGLQPGLYALCADRAGAVTLRGRVQPGLRVGAAAGIPDDLPLFLLDRRRLPAHRPRSSAAARTSPPTAASASACSPSSTRRSPRAGPRRTAGCSGKPARSARRSTSRPRPPASRGTGIGCFFDDGVHQLLGITDHALPEPLPLHRRRAG